MRKNSLPLIGAILSIIGFFIPIFIRIIGNNAFMIFGTGLILQTYIEPPTLVEILFPQDFTTVFYDSFTLIGILWMSVNYISVKKDKKKPKYGCIMGIMGGIFVILAPIIFYYLNNEVLSYGYSLYIGLFYPILPGIIGIIGGIITIKE